MSSILKALQRIEQNEGRTPTSAPVEPQPPPRSRLRLRALLAALALGGLVGLVAAFWWLPGGEVEPGLEPGPEVAEAPPARRASLARTRPAPAPTPPVAEPAGAPEPPAAVIEPPAPAPPSAAPAPEPAPSPALEPKPVAKPAPEPAPPPKPVAKPAPKPVPAAKPVAKPAPKPVPAAKPVAKPAPKPVPAAKPNPVPPAAGPAVARVEKLPALVVTRTVWHPDPARRRALVQVEGRAEPLELRHGDAVGALVVANIEPSGVIFRMGDVEVRRKIGQSPETKKGTKEGD
jgi:hypothetical protein